MKSLFLLLFICSLLRVDAYSLILPPKGPGDDPHVCAVWNGTMSPKEKIVNFGAHYCTLTLTKDSFGQWQVTKLDTEKKWKKDREWRCFKEGNRFIYLCVGDRCNTIRPVKESTEKLERERNKENECLNAIKYALDKSLPILYSLKCLAGSPPYALQLTESQSHCVVNFALDPVRKSCEVTKYSALKELNLNLTGNACINEDGYAVCYCDTSQCNWELEKFHPSLTSLGQSLGSRALSSCKPKSQCAVMKENTKAVKFLDRKESQICFIEYSADGTVKRMGRGELKKKTPIIDDRMCQVRENKGFVCFCKSHKCVAEFVPNNTPMYDDNWRLLERPEKYPTKLSLRHCGNPTVWTHDPEKKHICTKVFAQKGQDCSVSYEFVGSWTKGQCVEGKGKSVQCACETEKCHNEELKKHLRDASKQIDPSRKDCLIDIDPRATAPTTVPRTTDVPIEDDVVTSTVRIQEQSTTRQEKEKVSTTAATGSDSATWEHPTNGIYDGRTTTTTGPPNKQGPTSETSNSSEEKEGSSGGIQGWHIGAIIFGLLVLAAIATTVVVVIKKMKKKDGGDRNDKKSQENPKVPPPTTVIKTEKPVVSKDPIAPPPVENPKIQKTSIEPTDAELTAMETTTHTVATLDMDTTGSDSSTITDSGTDTQVQVTVSALKGIH